MTPTVGITNPPSNALLHEGDSIDVGAGASDYDDDGGVQTSAPVHVTVAPVIESIELPSLSEAVIKFAAPLNSSCTLEMAETLPTPAWTPLATIPPEPTLRWMRITNALPANATARFYRLRL